MDEVEEPGPGRVPAPRRVSRSGQIVTGEHPGICCNRLSSRPGMCACCSSSHSDLSISRVTQMSRDEMPFRLGA